MNRGGPGTLGKNAGRRVIVLLLTLVAAAPLVAQENDDPFAEDPFDGLELPDTAAEGGNQGARHETEAPATRAAISDRLISLSGELRYEPIVMIPYDDEYLKPVIGSNTAAADLDLSVEQGALGFTAAITVDSASALAVRELALRRAGDYTDLTIGRFLHAWSALDLFPLVDLFSAPRLPLESLAIESTPAVTGARLLGYLGPLAAEAVVVPMLDPNAAPPADLALVYGVETYPSDIPIDERSDEAARTLEQVQFAGRLGADVGPAVLYVIGYRGYASRSSTRTTTRFDAEAALAGDNPLSLEITHEREMVNAAGAAASVDLFGAAIDVEALLTFEDPLPVDLENELPPPVGAVTDRDVEYGTTVAISGGFDWRPLRFLRLLGEVSEHFVLDPPANLVDAALPGSSVFGAVDLSLATPKAELGLTSGPIYDWTGKEITIVGVLRADFFNGIASELSVLYFDLLDSVDATSAVAAGLEHAFLVGLKVSYSW